MPRYLSMIRVDEQNSPEGGPSPELAERMSTLFEEITKAGVMLDTAGLTPTSDGTREWTKRFLQIHEEHWTVTAEVRQIVDG
jgi:hypothetical protein